MRQWSCEAKFFSCDYTLLNPTNWFTFSTWFLFGKPNFDLTNQLQDSWNSNNPGKDWVIKLFFCIWILIKSTFFKVMLRQTQIALKLHFKDLKYRDAFLLIIIVIIIIIIIAPPAVAIGVLWISCSSFCPSILLLFHPEVFWGLAH